MFNLPALHEDTRWPALEPSDVKDEWAKELALGVVAQADIDRKDLCKKISKNKLCASELEKRKCMFEEIRKFLKSDWCSQLCGNSIRRSLMVAELERCYQKSGFLKQLKAFESGELQC